MFNHCPAWIDLAECEKLMTSALPNTAGKLLYAKHLHSASCFHFGLVRPGFHSRKKDCESKADQPCFALLNFLLEWCPFAAELPCAFVERGSTSYSPWIPAEPRSCGPEASAIGHQKLTSYVNGTSTHQPLPLPRNIHMFRGKECRRSSGHPGLA